MIFAKALIDTWNQIEGEKKNKKASVQNKTVETQQ